MQWVFWHGNIQNSHYFSINDECSICARINGRMLAARFWGFGDTLHSAALSFLKNDWKLILAKRFLWFDLFAWLLRDVIPWSVIFIRIAGSRGTWEALVPQIFETCKKCTFKNNEKSYKLQYFYLVKILKEEFHGLYKACDIKSELNYNGDLEGRQPLNIKTIF